MNHSSDVWIWDVPQILQNPELPNGCEITSCCELLHFWGYPADKCDLADHYLPRSEKWFGADPDQVYMGDPHREDSTERCGFYCFAGPIVTAANHYLRDHQGMGSAVTAVDITKATQPQLEQYLRDGFPFLFWASLHFADIGFDPRGRYQMENGNYHRLFQGLHCMVCKGMDSTYYYLSDPLNFNDRIEKAQFFKIYRQLGERAVVLIPMQSN